LPVLETVVGLSHKFVQRRCWHTTELGRACDTEARLHDMSHIAWLVIDTAMNLITNVKRDLASLHPANTLLANRQVAARRSIERERLSGPMEIR
jgi:hypothetical protein